MAEVEIHDQGKGVLPTHLVIAEEYLRQNKKKKTVENMVEIVNKLAKEKKESYTPSADMGKNPESRVAQEIKDAMAPWLYDSRVSVLNKLGMNDKERKETMVELNGAINHLTQIILKRVYKFKTKRDKNADLWDTNQLTDFEFPASHPKGLSKTQRVAYNSGVAANRQIRGIIQAWITASLIPILQTNRKDYYKEFAKTYSGASSTTVASKKVYKNLMRHLGKDFLFTFGQTKITDYLKNKRVSDKANFQNKEKVVKAKLPLLAASSKTPDKK